MHALRGVDMTIEPGEFVAIMGSSGSGKSTIMNMLGCLDKRARKVPARRRGRFRLGREAVGVDSQSQNGFCISGFNLLSRTSALENIELRHTLCAVGEGAAQARANEGAGNGRLGRAPGPLPTSFPVDSSSAWRLLARW